MSDLTRRDLLAALVATATAAAFDPYLANAQPADSDSEDDRQTLSAEVFPRFQEFIRVSEALTGINRDRLAPDQMTTDLGAPSGADPNQAVKFAYFKLATRNTAYTALQREFQSHAAEHPGNASAAAQKLLVSPTDGVKELARSIVMAWYFGVWYEWKVKGSKPRFTVVSSDAYTEGWVWRIAQAHPPGYSNLRFGHWAFPPPSSFDIELLKPGKKNV